MEFVLDGSPCKESSERKLLPMAKYSNSGPNHKFITLAYTLHKILHTPRDVFYVLHAITCNTWDPFDALHDHC